MTVLISGEKSVLSSVLSSVLGESIVQRYLTTLDSVFQQHFVFAATLVSGTPITLTVYPTNGTQGLPPGAPTVTNDKWQVISYTTTGNVDGAGFDGIDYFDGIIWDYSAPSIGVALALNEDFGTTTTAKNSLDPSGLTDATAIDITSSDLFTEQSNEDWLGEEDFWTFGLALSDGTEGANATLAGASGGVLVTGNTYAWEAVVSGLTVGSLKLRIGNTNVTDSSANETVSGIELATDSDLKVQIGNIQTNSGASMLPTVKQLLEKAP